MAGSKGFLSGDIQSTVNKCFSRATEGSFLSAFGENKTGRGMLKALGCWWGGQKGPQRKGDI